MIGRKSSKQGDALFPKIELGMSFVDAKALIEGEGEERAYDDLPVTPKPREIYAKLPGNTEWHVLAAVGKPTLILGIVEGKSPSNKSSGPRMANAKATRPHCRHISEIK
jgi:hypothetical protein